MRIAIVTSDTIFAAASLRRFAREQARNVVAVIITPTLPGAASNLQGLRRILMHSGVGYVALKVWINVITPRLARLRGGGHTLTDQLRAYGYTGEVRIASPRADSPELVHWLRTQTVDVLLSAGATHKFNDALLSVPRRSAVNMHPSLLPKYAGTDPYFWCMMNGDAVTGVTLHRTTSQIDAGPVVAQREIPLADCPSVLSLIVRMWEANDAMIADFFASGADVSNARPQQVNGRVMLKRPSKADVRVLRQHGRSLADVQAARDALTIARAC